ncbi:MAG: hypothetical protein HRT89_02520 [Lentisphaeria bacterium]|nr:hypothetical protein [Lentisphaeria bacterium]NQZ66923.1 hypothetical protein [Lentisphaeria bacterium]
MNIDTAKILDSNESDFDYKDDTLIVSTTCGTMWGKGNTCSNLFIFPLQLKEASVELSLDLYPQFNGEQAGIVLFIDSDNYIKFIREMVGDKQVVVLAKEIDGEASPELITPFEPSDTNLQLDIRNDSITVQWKSHEENEFQKSEFPNWFEADSKFQVGLLVHGNNPLNQAKFYSLKIDGQAQ